MATAKTTSIPKDNSKNLDYHIKNVMLGNRRFENIYQSLTRMILGDHQKMEKVTVNGRYTYDFKVFRQGSKHIIGMYDEINSFVSFVKDAAEGGSSKEMAFILIGEPGNGKTFFVDHLSSLYRTFVSHQENRRYTFKFTNLDKIGGYGKITQVESQTYEDPMVLAMNLFEAKEDNIKFLSETGFKDKQIEELYKNYRPLGSCTYYILNQIKDYADGNIEKMKEFIEISSVPVSESRGTITGKYAAKDKITSSAADLIGEESITRLLHITETDHPYRFDLRRGALARVAGGGIHFADEIFKNKRILA
jgi:serine protein kinase